MLRLTVYLCLISLVAMATACSSGSGQTDPGLPGSHGSTMTQLPFYVNQVSDEVVSGTGAIGVFEVHLDLESMNYELLPTRHSSFVPGQYEVDLTLALSSTFCKDCFKISGLSINADGNVLLQTAVKHPFPQITELPAPRPQRPDLHIFDVQGIVVIEGSTSFPRSGVTLNPNFVVNADGYTTAFDSVIDNLGSQFFTTANCHPFKILSKGDYTNPASEIGNYDPLSLNGYPNPTGIINPTGFNVLKCGSGYKYTTYELNPDGSTVSFFFVVTASYGQSARGLGTELQKRDNPIYLLPAFSKPEAWWVKVDVENNYLADSDNTSTAEVVVRVADWQHAWGVTPANPDFDPAIDQSIRRNTLLKESSVNVVEVDIPGLNLPVDDSSAITPTGMGAYTNPLTYRITVNNDTFASEIPDPNNPPQFWGLVAVKDDLEQTTNPAGGIDRDLDINDSFFEISDYTTYQLFGISIFPPNDPPVPIITCTDPGGAPPYAIDSGYFIDVHGMDSFDTDGDIIKYEWDFDYEVGGLFASPGDPNYFLQDDPLDPDFGNPPPWQMNNLYDYSDSKYIALKVTDDSVGAAQSTTWVEVRLGPNQPPVADLGVAFYDTLLPPISEPFTFYEGERVILRPGPDTADDGMITTYQYDFNYDGTLFMVNAANTSGAAVLSPPQNQGTKDMATRVIDNGIPNLSSIDFKAINILGRAAHPPVQVSDDGAADVNMKSAGYRSIAVSNNYILVAWAQTANLRDLFYSYSNDGGTTWSAPAVMNTTTTGTQQYVALASDPASDVFYAVFEDNSSGAFQISYAISDTTAANWWPAARQGTLSAVGTSPSNPSIAYDPGGNGIFVGYISSVAGNKEVVVRTSADNGATWSDGVFANTTNTNDRTDASIAIDTTNNRVGIAWDDLRGGSAYQIFFNYSNTATLAFQVTDIHVAPSAGGQTDPSLINYNGRWFMSYDDLSETTDIFFTASADGIDWIEPVDITDNTSGVHNDSSIGVDVTTGTIYITTRDNRESSIPSQADIYVFKSNDHGATWVRGVRINERVGTENSFNPSIVGLPAGGFAVAFRSPDNVVRVALSNAY